MSMTATKARVSNDKPYMPPVRCRAHPHTRRRRSRVTGLTTYEDALNLHSYVGADPVNFTDPTGLERFCSNQQVGGRRDGDTVTAYIREVCYNFDRGGGRGGFDDNFRGGGVSILIDCRIPMRCANPNPTPPPAPPQRQPTRKLTECQKSFLARQLSQRGLPSGQLGQVRFVSGLDSAAVSTTRVAFNGGAVAVTQGNTIYVQPSSFGVVAGLAREHRLKKLFTLRNSRQQAEQDFTILTAYRLSVG